MSQTLKKPNMYPDIQISYITMEIYTKCIYHMAIWNSPKYFKKNKLAFLFSKGELPTLGCPFPQGLLLGTNGTLLKHGCKQPASQLTSTVGFLAGPFRGKITVFKFSCTPYHKNFLPAIFKMAFKVSLAQVPDLWYPWYTPEASSSDYLRI